MDFIKIQSDLKTYLLTVRDIDGNFVFKQEDFTNTRSNISLLANFLAYYGVILQNKQRLYKDNSILSTTTDFNLARKLAKIVYNYDWLANQPTTLQSNVGWVDTTGYQFNITDYIVIPKLTNMTFAGYPYYTTNELIIRADNSGNPIVENLPLLLNQGSYETRIYTQTDDLLIVLDEASKINVLDVFVDKDVLDSSTGILSKQTVQYYRDSEFLELTENEDEENIFYLDYYNDNVVIRFNDKVTNGYNITVIVYKNEGTLSSFDSIDFTTEKLQFADSFLYNGHNITNNIVFSVDKENSFNGSAAETLSQLQSLGNKSFINRGVNENDFNELLKRSYPTYKLRVTGGENEEQERFLGYLIFNGVDDNRNLMTVSEIKQIKNSIDDIRSINLRSIYKSPTILNIDYDVKLIMKTQYKGQFATYKSKIISDIESYYNDTLYLDTLVSQREYVFNRLYTMEDTIMDYVDNFSIIQYPCLRFDKRLLNFVDKVIGAVQLNSNGEFVTATGSDYVYNNSYTDTLFNFGNFTLTAQQIWNLYLNYEIINFSGFPYIRFRLYDTPIDLGSPLNSNCNITYGSDYSSAITQYKFAFGDNYYSINTISGSTNNEIITNKILDTSDPDNPRVYATEIYYQYKALKNFSSTEQFRKMFFKLYKPVGSEHFVNDITFEKEVFVLYDVINVFE